jgi:DNA polymerase IIIc chi subunit
VARIRDAGGRRAYVSPKPAAVADELDHAYWQAEQNEVIARALAGVYAEPRDGLFVDEPDPYSRNPRVAPPRLWLLPRAVRDARERAKQIADALKWELSQARQARYRAAARAQGTARWKERWGPRPAIVYSPKKYPPRPPRQPSRLDRSLMALDALTRAQQAWDEYVAEVGKPTTWRAERLAQQVAAKRAGLSRARLADLLVRPSTRGKF